jgi:hypothetical protein
MVVGQETPVTELVHTPGGEVGRQVGVPSVDHVDGPPP